MVFILWFAAAWILWSILLVVSRVGKPSRPITGGTAAFAVLVWGVILVAIIWAALEV